MKADDEFLHPRLVGVFFALLCFAAGVLAVNLLVLT